MSNENLVKVLAGILLTIVVWWVSDVTLHMRRLEKLESQFEYLHGDKIPEKK